VTTQALPSGTQRRVLVIDDHEPTAVGLSRLIRVLGHTVHIASSGQAALDSVDDFRPDLILLDIGLPHMDGYEVVRQLRANPLLARVTIVALTGYGSASDRARSRASGFDHHLVKPVQFKAVAVLLDPPDAPPVS
jgi:two-component system OmpR family response regulator